MDAREAAEQARKRAADSATMQARASQRPGPAASGPALKSRPDPTYDSTRTPTAVPLPPSGPVSVPEGTQPRTKRRSFGVGEGD